MSEARCEVPNLAEWSRSKKFALTGRVDRG